MVTVRTLREDDEGSIRDLFRLCFGKELSREEWVWKYLKSPWGTTASVAQYGDEIIAHYGGLGERFYYKGRTFKVFQPCDVMTHPKFRARIFSKKGAIVRAGEHFYATNSMDFAFGFPSERHAILGTKQLGYTKHGYVATMTKEISGPGRWRKALTKIELGWDSMTGTDLDLLWEAVRDNTCLSIEKNSRYIFWRYRDNPGKQYLPLIVKSRFRKRPAAFGVLSFKESGLLVQDFFCTGGMDVRSLLGLFERMATDRGMESLTVWSNPGDSLFKTLVDCGFAQEKGIPYIFKIMNTELRPEFLFDSYWYRMGDYDAS